MEKKKHKAIWIALSIIAAMLIITLVVISLFYYNAKIDTSKLNVKSSAVRVFDKNGGLIYEDCRDYADYSAIPQHLINAFVSIEDKRFFEHKGVDTYRMAGAAVKNVKHGGFKEGASTITQQLIKNTHLNSEKTIERKINEIFLALKLEKKLSKQDIIEKYLNILYFGGGIYGVTQASKTFFNKELSSLTASECALLAGIVKNPSKYSPSNAKSDYIIRRNTVLNAMYENNKLTQAEYETALAENIKIINISARVNYSPFVRAAIEQACKELKTDIRGLKLGNVRIYTYYDNVVQQTVENNAKKKSFGQNTQNIVLMLDNLTAGINAYYGDIDYSIGSFARQIGSTIKPLHSYANALEYGNYSPSSFVEDSEINIDGYSPRNYADKYYGRISLRSALEKSSNTVAVALAANLGKENCLNTARRLGLSLADGDTNLAVALGGTNKGVNLISLLSAYSSLARGGITASPSFIRLITNSENKQLYCHNQEFRRGITSQTAYLLTNMLMSTSKRGTAKALTSLPFDVACKTGTVSSSDDNFNSDAYSLSYTSTDTMLVWYGAKDKIMMEKQFTGGGISCMLAANIYDELYKDNQPSPFSVPNEIIYKTIDKYSYEKKNEIELASEFTPEHFRENEVFTLQNAPSVISTTFDPPTIRLITNQQIGNTVYISFFTEIDTTYTIKKQIISVFGNQKEIVFDTIIGDGRLYQFSSECSAWRREIITIMPQKTVLDRVIEGEIFSLMR